MDIDLATLSNMFFLYYTDYEHIVILIGLAFLFVIGLKRKQSDNFGTNICMDMNYSIAIKGIACVMILLGHFEQRMQTTFTNSFHIGSLVQLTSANIALVWFVFISGYGLSKSKKISNNVVSSYFIRFKKIYIPLLLVSLISMLIYYFLPDIHKLSTYKQFYIPEYIHLTKTITVNNILNIIYGMLGLNNWYVKFILILYAIYYFSIYLHRHFSCSITDILFFLLLSYYIITFWILGESLGHYYRLVWAFFGGHIFSNYSTIPRSKILVYSSAFITTWLFEGIFMVASFLFAIGLLSVFLSLNKKYDIHNRTLLWLGSISYFFYLVHTPLSWPIIFYLGKYDIFLWLFLTLLLSYAIEKVYKYLF